MGKIKEKFWREFKAYWLNVLYITLCFTVFVDYARLILAHHEIKYAHYGISVINGLILGKVILIAEHLKVGQGFEDKPLIIPTLYKSFLFTLCVLLLGTIELTIRTLIQTHNPATIVDALISKISYAWFAKILIVFVVFIPFFSMKELSRVLGEGKISALFFKSRPRPANQ
ncbi:MAG: hypothetical protein PHW54_00280 [Candidatus Omnitrophica bacterium]|jgi:hypothetical protein|nr:hypothetical protein [Candidatus Omnitrophota bacterium]